jgi:hypothetical protein
MDITIMNRKLEVKYYKSLMSTLKKINEDYSWVEKHIHYLENTSSSNETEQVETEVKEKEVVQDNDHYKKPWTKLNVVHKILKMKEFINNLKEINTTDKEMLKEQLCQLIKDKVLSKKEKVNYDMVNGKIISLLDLQYKDNKYIYLSE